MDVEVCEVNPFTDVAFMWTPKAIEVLSATLDLCFSGQGKVNVRQLQADGMIVCNGLDEMDWSVKSPQFELCEFCFTPQCVGGGRWAVCLRRLSGRVRHTLAQAGGVVWGARSDAILTSLMTAGIPSHLGGWHGCSP